MEDELLKKYFIELRKEANNEDFINELEGSIETISREEIVELIKKHY